MRCPRRCAHQIGPAGKYFQTSGDRWKILASRANPHLPFSARPSLPETGDSGGWRSASFYGKSGGIRGRIGGNMQGQDGSSGGPPNGHPSFDQIVADGFAITMNVAGSGLAAVAAPVFDANHKILFSVGCSAPVARATQKQLVAVRHRLVEVTNQMTQKLGGRSHGRLTAA